MSSKDKKTGSTTTFQQQFGVDQSAESDAEQKETEMLLEHPSYVELQNQLTAAEEKATQSWERLLRLQADTDNMQRRVERDIANAHKYALEKFALELLPVIDSLERAIIVHVGEEVEATSWLDGVSLTLKMFMAAMEKFGIEQVDPQGQAFNPELHQAVSTQSDPAVKSGTVLAVLQKGYLLNKRLIRPALVVVAQ